MTKHKKEIENIGMIKGDYMLEEKEFEGNVLVELILHEDVCHKMVHSSGSFLRKEI